MPDASSKRTRRWQGCFSPALYRGRITVGCMVCRLMDFRRIATRSDKLAATVLGATYLAAAVSYCR